MLKIEAWANILETRKFLVLQSYGFYSKKDVRGPAPRLLTPGAAGVDRVYL